MNNNPASLLFNLVDTTKDIITQAVNNGTILASEDKVNTRIELCYNCDSLDKKQVRCMLCGCYMKTKVRFDASKCPAEKW